MNFLSKKRKNASDREFYYLYDAIRQFTKFVLQFITIIYTMYYNFLVS
jgi:hypothetical protein